MEDQKIQDLQDELRTILESKIQNLSQQVRDTEDITRQIITTELQLKNFAEKKQQLQFGRKKLRRYGLAKTYGAVSNLSGSAGSTKSRCG